jgi:aldose 1-epimerase
MELTAQLDKAVHAVDLENGGARAKILPGRGGLLASLTLPTGGGERELLWLPPDFAAAPAVSSGWPGGGAPWLFPFAGRVFHGGQVGRYELPRGGAVYDMPIHGFAYGSSWRIVTRSPHSLTLLLASGEASRQLYPFDFTLKATYDLTARAIRCGLQITAGEGNAAPMPVAAGMHPYFRLADAGETALQHWNLDVEAAEEVRVTPTGAAGKATPLASGGARRRLDNPHFHNLILGKLRSPSAALHDERGGAQTTLRAEPAAAFNYFVLWSKPAAGFYCLEPWMGLPDAVNVGAGLKWLHAGETLQLLVEIGSR